MKSREDWCLLFLVFVAFLVFVHEGDDRFSVDNFCEEVLEHFEDEFGGVVDARGGEDDFEMGFLFGEKGDKGEGCRVFIDHFGDNPDGELLIEKSHLFRCFDHMEIVHEVVRGGAFEVVVGEEAKILQEVEVNWDNPIRNPFSKIFGEFSIRLFQCRWIDHNL